MALVLPEFVFAANKTLTTRNGHKSGVREILLSNFKLRSLKPDLPIDSMAMDGKESLWMTGKTSLWRWDLRTNELQKVRLLKPGSNDRLRKVLIEANSILVMSNQRIFEIPFSSRRIIQLKSKNKRVVSLDLTSSRTGLYWITTGGVYVADLKNQSLVHMSQAPKLFSLDKAVFIPESGALWYVRGKKAFMRNLVAEKIQTKLILGTRNKITGIHRFGGDVFLHTKFSVLRFSTRGILRQRIPVEGQRKLVTMSITNHLHSYLFSDKLLEVFDLKRRRENHFRLDVGIVRKARNLVSQGSKIALIADGVPKAFQLSGKW